ncbi:MAG: GIY-YIG nuclease family protein [Colwellia sp.]|nr:GIY-YIG nuclease family protein [Colwellia sp.]
MKNIAQSAPKSEVSFGNVYVMRHSFFTDVIRIGCTPDDPEIYTKTLSNKTLGDYTLVFSLQCTNPCHVKKQIQKYLNEQEYVNEFYQVTSEVAEGLLKRESLRIPMIIT